MTGCKRNGGLSAGLIFAGLSSLACGATGQLRIATYNIEADITGQNPVTTPRAGLYTAIEAMGAASTSVSSARPLDILGLEETTSEATTVSPIVTALNSYYAGSAVYALTGLQGTDDSAGATGNGPNSLIYNTSTLTLLQAIGVGTPNSTSEPRQITRYEFQPRGGTAAGNFYVYVEHYKSGSNTKTDSSNGDTRNAEAQVLRTNSAALGAGAHVIYTGDFNTDPVLASSTTTGESTFTTLESTATAGGAIDPLNNTGNGNKSSYTDSSASLSYRDDYELQTGPMINDPTGTEFLTGSYTVFGNNNGTLDSSKSSYLSTASDHLPVFADYSYVLAPEPASVAVLGLMGLSGLRRRRT